MKRIISIFVSAFALNLVWENLHSVLYTNYKGGSITEWVLVRATFWDAVMITALAFLFIKINYFRSRTWLVLLFGIVLGGGIEYWALRTARWAYTSSMPLVPFTHLGLSPTLQLGVLAYLIFLVFI